MNNEQDLTHAKLIQDWVDGRPLPRRVKVVTDWLLWRFPVGPPLESFEQEALAEQASANGWRAQDIERAVLLWRLVTERDNSGKPGT